MQTWRIRMIDQQGRTLKRRQALLRYLYGSLWVIPCVLLQWAFHLEQWHIIEMLFAVALFFWPLTIYLDRKDPKQRQALSDRFAGTRLVELPKNSVTLS
jgi:4-hydroxybenzoate polyprenyltransferase